MKKVFAETYPSGYIVTSINSVTVANNTAKSETFTVPDDTVWVVDSIRAVNPDDVARDIYIRWFKESALTNKISNLMFGASGAGGDIVWPNTAAIGASYNENPPSIVMSAGETIEIYFAAGGASTGGTLANSIVIHRRVLSKT